MQRILMWVLIFAIPFQMWAASWKDYKLVGEVQMLTARVYAAEGSENKLDRVEIYAFDKNGFLTELLILNSDMEMRSRTQYEILNKRVKRMNYFEDENGLVSYNVYTYNDRGICSEERCYNGEDQLMWSSKYVYGQNGKMLEFTHYLSNGGIVGIYRYEYDVKDRESKQTLFDPDKQAISQYVYLYDDQGRESEYRNQSMTGELSWKLAFKYDIAGNISEIMSCDETGKPVQSSEYIYVVDKNPKVVNDYYFEKSTGKKKLMFMKVYDYIYYKK